MSAFRSTFVAAAALVLLGGCGEAGGAGDPAGSADPGLGDLQGRSFQSVSLVDRAAQPLQPGTSVLLSFTEDSVSGSAGCNPVGSTATLTDGRLVVRGPVGGTEMGCGERQYHDRWISDLLTSRPELVLDGDHLTLTSAGTVVQLVDSKSAEPAPSLAGTLWTLETVEEGPGSDGAVSSVPTRVTSTLEFGPKRLLARLGCNGGSASYEVDGDALRLQPVMQTAMDCGGPRMQIESTVVGVLRGTVTWSVENSQLRLTQGERTLVYSAG